MDLSGLMEDISRDLECWHVEFRVKTSLNIELGVKSKVEYGISYPKSPPFIYAHHSHYKSMVKQIPLFLAHTDTRTYKLIFTFGGCLKIGNANHLWRQFVISKYKNAGTFGIHSHHPGGGQLETNTNLFPSYLMLTYLYSLYDQTISRNQN